MHLKQTSAETTLSVDVSSGSFYTDFIKTEFSLVFLDWRWESNIYIFDFWLI